MSWVRSSPHCWRRLGEPFMPMNRRQEAEAFVPPSTVPSMPEKEWLRDVVPDIQAKRTPLV